jgi:outer membrane receptor protein involved in Fe transport
LRLRLERGIHNWSAAAGIYRQLTVGLSDRRDATNIFTAWVQTPSNDAMQSVHGLMGYRFEPAPWLEFSVEGFYKTMSNIFIGEWTAFPSFTTRLQEAHGDSHGFDLRVEVRRPRFYGFINYGYSSTRYEIDPESPATVNPGRFRPPHDRRHQINVLATTSLHGFELNARWQFGSGLPFTPVEGFDGFILMDGAVDVTEVRGFPRVIYESIPYRGVLPTYHRLDVTVERTFDLPLGSELTAQVGVLNAYDRANLFSLDLLTAKRTDQLPVIPIAGLKIGF